MQYRTSFLASVFSIRLKFAQCLVLALTALLSGEAMAGVFYNLQDYTSGLDARVTLPASWDTNPGTVGYAGSLDVHWLARLASNNESVTVSKANAIAQGAPANFSLLTAPDNCWGMTMNFGLVTLAQGANLTVTVEADGSSIKPGFALYRGWDTGAGASRHDTIFFSGDNPLGTTGLTALGDSLSATAGGSTSRTFSNLLAGNYEVFVTVGANDSASGGYKVTLTTTPVASVPGAPTAVSATAGDGQATVSWNAPVSNGGAAISGYTVTSAPGAKTCTSTALDTHCTVTGLTNGTPYTFTVTAANSAGNSPASDPSASVTPTGAVSGGVSVIALTAGADAPFVFGSGQLSHTFSAANDAWGKPESGTLGMARKSGWGVVKLIKGVAVKLVVTTGNADVHPGISVWKRPGPSEYRYGPLERVKIGGVWIRQPSLVLADLLDFNFVPALQYEQVRSNHVTGASECGAGCELTVNGSPVSSGNIRMQFIKAGYDKDGAALPQPINGDPALKGLSGDGAGKVEVSFTPNETTTYQFAVGGIYPSGSEAAAPGLMRNFAVQIESAGVMDLP